MKALGGFLNAIDHLNEWVGRIFGFLIIALMVLVVSDTCLRYFFNSPLYWGADMDRIFMLMVVALGGGYCLLHGGHVKVDIIYARWSPRAKAIVDLITYLSVFIICVILVRYGGKMMWQSFSIGEVSSESAWEYIMWPVRLMVPLAGVLLGLQALAKWIRDLATAIAGVKKLESKVVRGEGGLRG